MVLFLLILITNCSGTQNSKPNLIFYVSTNFQLLFSFISRVIMFFMSPLFCTCTSCDFVVFDMLIGRYGVCKLEFFCMLTKSKNQNLQYIIQFPTLRNIDKVSQYTQQFHRTEVHTKKCFFSAAKEEKNVGRKITKPYALQKVSFNRCVAGKCRINSSF